MIKLDQYYALTADANNWTLNYAREKEIIKDGVTKTVTERDTFYYPLITMALRKYLDESVKDCSDIKEVLSKIEEVHNTIKNIK